MAKQIIAPALNTPIGGPLRPFETSGDLIQGAIQRLVDRAIESGIVRPDLDHSDLLRALVDVPDVASLPDWLQSASETVDILLLGSCPIKEKHFSHYEPSDSREKVRPRVVILISLSAPSFQPCVLSLILNAHNLMLVCLYQLGLTEGSSYRRTGSSA